jgi:glutamate formiminotransferase / 5-formyltetrahydrofolate cyclo-ligase
MSPASPPPSVLMAVPNVSEGRDPATVRAIASAFGGGGGAGGNADVQGGGYGEDGGAPEGEVRLLDVHSDADHHRSVYTLAGSPAALGEALLRGAREAVERIDVMGEPGADGRGEPAKALAGEQAPGDAQTADNAQTRLLPPRAHPHVGSLDVAPVVYLDEAARGAACAWALVLADRIGDELGVPVFLYGELAAGRTRAQLRRGGIAGLTRRMAAGELRPDFGPPRLHPRAGATLVAAREPLVAFNLHLAPPATLTDARRIAALVREGGPEGLPGVRAIGVALGDGVAQVSLNVERPLETPLALAIERVRAHARVADGELVGLAPLAALEGFPADLPLPGFDPARHVIERAIGL